MENSQLYHHGIKGMRWGVRRTPEQLGYSTNTSKAKQKKTFGIFKKKGTAKKNQTEEPEDIEVKKQRILKSRSPKELYKHADLFTDNELQSAYNRLNLERNIANLSPKEVDKGKQFVQNVADWGNKINNLSDAGIKMYNNVARVYNTFSSNGSSSPLPTISGNNNNNNRNN